MKPSPCFLLTFLGFAAVAHADVTVNAPFSGEEVTLPVQYTARATTTTCAQGVASRGIYIDNQLIYVVNGTRLNTRISMNTGSEHTVVEEWHYCGGAAYTTLNITVEAPAVPVVSITADSPTIAAGHSSTLTVTATNATQASITGTDGSTYTLQPNGGTVNVSPNATTTYTAEVSGSGGQNSETATATVIPASSPNAIQHVVFMLQENHTFDDYFGMLNPYRKTNGWNIGDDGKEYDVDGIDDKLTTIGNQDDEGTVYDLCKVRTTCIDDLTWDWLASYGDVNRWNYVLGMC